MMTQPPSMRLDVNRNFSTGEVAVKGNGFDVVIQQNGEVVIHFQERTIRVSPKQEEGA